MNVTLEYFGVHTTGKSVTEAKKEAGKIIERVMKDDFTPIYIHGRVYSAFVWNTPSGWSYTTLENSKEGIARLSSCNIGYTRDEILSHVCLHLAQINWAHDQPDICELLTEYPDKQRDFNSWCNWQRGYKAARNDGLSDSEARNCADHYIHA